MSSYFGLSTENIVYHYAIAGLSCYEERTQQERNENALGDGYRIYWSMLRFKPQDFSERHTQSARQRMMNGQDLPAKSLRKDLCAHSGLWPLVLQIVWFSRCLVKTEFLLLLSHIDYFLPPRIHQGCWDGISITLSLRSSELDQTLKIPICHKHKNNRLKMSNKWLILVSNARYRSSHSAKSNTKPNMSRLE